MIFYFSVAGIYGSFLIYKMLWDQNCSHSDLASWIVIAIATLFWIVVIPVSILEIFAKNKVEFDTAVSSQTIPESRNNFDTFSY